MSVLRWTGLVFVVAMSFVVALAPPVLAWMPWDLNSLFPLLYLVPGLVVMARRPWHQVGWLLLLIGLGISMTSLPVTPPGLDPRWYPWLAWINGSWSGYFGFTAMAALLVVFPDGLARRSERDRRIGRRIIGMMVAVTVLSATSDPVGPDASTSFPNPLGLHLVPKTLTDFGFVAVILTLLGCVVWLWRRRRLTDNEEQRRYTLILYAFWLAVAGLLFGILLSGVLGDGAWMGALVGWYALPTAFAYAVLRHGLYGVDRLVRRTVGYAGVAVVVAAVYIAPVLLLPRLLGESNDLVIAASTLAAAAVFNPVRSRIQRAVDRRFDRARYDAQREIDSLSTRLAGEVELVTLTDDLDGVVRRTLAPSSVALWLRPGRAADRP